MFNELYENGIGASLNSYSSVWEMNKVQNNGVGIDIVGGQHDLGKQTVLSCNSEVDLRVGAFAEATAERNKWDHVPPSALPGPGRDVEGVVSTTGASLADSPCE